MTSQIRFKNGHSYTSDQQWMFDSDGDQSDEMMEPTKAEVTKQRKAMNQRRYYQRNKLVEQAKGRLRASNLTMFPRKRGLGLIANSSSRFSSSEMSPPTSPPTHNYFLNRTSPLPGDRCPLPLAPALINFLVSTESAGHPLKSIPTHPPCANISGPPVPTDILQDWALWSARRRMVALRRWMLDLEWEAGALDRWPAVFKDEWLAINQRSHQSSNQLILEAAEGKVTTGKLMLAYLGRVMDGELSGDLEECRDLALQIHQLSKTLHSVVIGLEYSISLRNQQRVISFATWPLATAAQVAFLHSLSLQAPSPSHAPFNVAVAGWREEGCVAAPSRPAEPGLAMAAPREQHRRGHPS
ncbi:hypothetical protein FIBSPDRAFT_899895 [Athelia psychrophila]|uniref:Uncharacterized protein n=1 Tax=Athelia psychrophila TaxID=1759441 RepID=A0A165Z3S5_9AGAM|nr:hypothetical protein FIBSPDRAFT_899895 [Fibularhizoctonia sp. CBS 109695]